MKIISIQDIHLFWSYALFLSLRYLIGYEWNTFAFPHNLSLRITGKKRLFSKRPLAQAVAKQFSNEILKRQKKNGKIYIKPVR